MQGKKKTKRQIFFSLPFQIYFIFVVMLFGFWVFPSFGINLFPSVLQSTIDNPQEPDYQKVFDSIHMPSDFKYISSNFAHDGSEGSLSLHRRYSVHRTRETVIKELEPVFDKKGYDLSTNIKDYGIGNDDYLTYTSKPIGFFITLYPINTMPTGCTDDSSNPKCFDSSWNIDMPNKEVDYVDIRLGN